MRGRSDQPTRRLRKSATSVPRPGARRATPKRYRASRWILNSGRARGRQRFRRRAPEADRASPRVGCSCELTAIAAEARWGSTRGRTGSTSGRQHWRRPRRPTTTYFEGCPTTVRRAMSIEWGREPGSMPRVDPAADQPCLRRAGRFRRTSDSRPMRSPSLPSSTARRRIGRGALPPLRSALVTNIAACRDHPNGDPLTPPKS